MIEPEASIFTYLRTATNSFIDGQIDSIFQVSDSVLSVFVYIAFAGALVRIFMNYRDGGSFFGYVSYIPLTVLLFFYTDIIGGLYGLGGNLNQTFDQSSVLQAFFAEPEMSEEEDISIFSLSLSVALQATKIMAMGAIVKMLLAFSQLISLLAFFYLKVKILIKIIVLTFFGPINISLSFIPGLGNNWVGWLLKVIEISAYIPVLYFIEWAGNQMLIEVFKPQVVDNPQDFAQSYINSLLGIFFFVIMIFSYLSIPKIVNWGLSTAQSSFGGVAKKAAAVGATVATKGVL